MSYTAKNLKEKREGRKKHDNTVRSKPSLKYQRLRWLINKNWLFPAIAIAEISIFIILILIILLTPVIKIPLYTQQNTIFNETIYPDENFSERIGWSGITNYPISDIYLSIQTDRDIYLYIFNQNQYIHYLERKVQSLSITNLECIASIKDENEGFISLRLSYQVNPLYIIIDTNGALTEVEINSLTYRYTIFERSWYLGALIIFIGFFITAIIAFYIKKKYNPWKYFHPKITEIAYQKFKDGHYDDAILSVYNEIEPLFKIIASRKGHGFKFGWKAIEKLMDEENPIIKFPDIISVDEEEKKNRRESYKSLFQANFSFTRNPIAHNNLIFQKYEAYRQLGILDELLKILEKGKIDCKKCGAEVGFFEYIDNHKH